MIKNKVIGFAIMLLLCINIFFFLSCPGDTDDKEQEETGPFECEIRLKNGSPTYTFSLFLGLNDDFFDVENAGGTDVVNGEEVIIDVPPEGTSEPYTIELEMEESIQRDWLPGRFNEMGGVWSFLNPTPPEDGDGFTFTKNKAYVVEIADDSSTVTISQSTK